LQNVLYAEAKHAVLVVLQAMDTGGKDGVVRKVFGPLNSQGVTVTSFKRPTAVELAHDYLWRIHQNVPARGQLGIFNRSHYEDVLVARVHELAARGKIEERYEQINQFEKYLSENGVTILKFFLHISKAEQKRRLQARLDDAQKNWKFEPGDLAERKYWDRYMQANELVLTRCATPWAPWHVIPADRKWHRDWLVAKFTRAALEELHPRYPKPAEGLDKVVIED